MLVRRSVPMLALATTIAALPVLVPAGLAAQAPVSPAPAAAPGAAPGAAPAPATGAPGAAAPPVQLARASWLNDRRLLQVGDILTVVVDEQTSATERVSTNATANRSHSLPLNIGVDPANKLGPIKQFSTGSNASSQDQGQAQRSGNLTATLAVKVTGVDALGNARIEGAKVVAVDGRNQEVKLTGLVRPEDVTFDYQVSSARIADATISYKGKKIGPRMGIIGKILSILWP